MPANCHHRMTGQPFTLGFVNFSSSSRPPYRHPGPLPSFRRKPESNLRGMTAKLGLRRRPDGILTGRRPRRHPGPSIAIPAPYPSFRRKPESTLREYRQSRGCAGIR